MPSPSPAPALTPAGLYPRALIALLTCCTAVGVLSVTLYIPSLPAIRESLGASEAQVQATLGWFLLGFAAMQILSGPLSDRFGRRPVMLGGLLLYVAASAGCALSTDIATLQLFRLLQGGAACFAPVVARAVVRDSFPKEEIAKVFAIVSIALAIAPAAGPTIGGFTEAWFGWRAGFWILALFGAVMFAVNAVWLRESNRDRQANALRVGRLAHIYGHLFVNRTFMGATLLASFLFSGMFFYNAMGPFLLIEALGISPQSYALLMAITVGAFAGGSVIARVLIGRMRPWTIAAMALVSSAIGAAMMIAGADTLSVARVIAPMFLYLVGVGIIFPTAMSAALGPFPRVAGSASGMLGLLQMGMAGAASFSASFLRDGTALPLGWAMLAMCAGSLLALLALRGRME